VDPLEEARHELGVDEQDLVDLAGREGVDDGLGEPLGLAKVGASDMPTYRCAIGICRKLK